MSEVSIDQEKNNKIKQSLENLKSRGSKVMFCVQESPTPNASTYEIYFHASVIKKMGYNVVMLVESDEYIIPNWIENKLTDVKHMTFNSKIVVAPEDIMIIPEIYSNIMEATKNLPCIRIGLLQSVDYMLNAIMPGINWNFFGINNIITTSQTLKDWMENFYGKTTFNIKKYNIGIPDYFTKSKLPQKPIISIVGRNENEIKKLVKLFYSKYPHYSFVSFDVMVTSSKPPQRMRRNDFAERLKNNFAAVWIDRISSFGTFPLECMKSGVIPVCLKPDITPEYLIDRTGEELKIKQAGVWTNDFYELPDLIADVLIKFLDDSIPEEVYKRMDLAVENYTQENSEKQLTEIYENVVNSRIKLFEDALIKE